MRDREPDDPQLHEELASHLATCNACQDDTADPIGRLLAHVSQDIVAPSPDFTQKVIARLPYTSPQQFGQHAQSRRRLVVGISSVPVAALLIVIGLSPLFRTMTAGSTLHLVADLVQQVALAARWPLLLMLISSVGLGAVFVHLVHMPTTRQAVLAIAAAVVLVGVSASASMINDINNAQTTEGSAASRATIARSIETTQPVQGSVATLFGDVTVAQPVDGNVASLFGNVVATAPIDGRVLVGSGRYTGDRDRVAGGVVDDLDQLVLATGIVVVDRSDLMPQRGQLAVTLVGVLLLLALLGLTAALWPDPLARASTMLVTEPWPVLGLGTLLASLCLLLAGPVLAVLAWSVVGLLVAPLIALVLHLPLIFGLTVIGGVLGQLLFKHATLWTSLTANGVVLLGIFALSLIAPIAGAVAFYLLASVGVGALLLSTRRLALA